MPTPVPAPVATRSRLHELLARFVPGRGVVLDARPSAGSDAARAGEDAGLGVDGVSGGPLTGRSTTTGGRGGLGPRLLGLVAFTASAVAVAWAFRAWYGGPMLPVRVFAVGSVAWLAAGALVRIARRPVGSSSGSRERGGPQLALVLLWIGFLWAFLSLLPVR